MSAITHERYNEFGKTSYINKSYIPETFCVGSVGQYMSINSVVPETALLCSLISDGMPKVVLGVSIYPSSEVNLFTFSHAKMHHKFKCPQLGASNPFIFYF